MKSNTEMAGQEAQQPPLLHYLLLGPDSNYSATCQLKNNRSRAHQLTGGVSYFCLVISGVIYFQISDVFHLFIHYSPVTNVISTIFYKKASVALGVRVCVVLYPGSVSVLPSLTTHFTATPIFALRLDQTSGLNLGVSSCL